MEPSPFSRKNPTPSVSEQQGTLSTETNVEPFDLRREIASLISLTDELSRPNLNALAELLRDFNAVKFNMKFFGYEMARKLASELPPVPMGGPFEIDLESKASTQLDLESNWTRHWSAELKIPHVFHRKIWELAYVLQAAWQGGFMRDGARGLGFGCGEEPLPSYLASKGLHITVTDLEPSDERASGWAKTNELASLDRAYRSEFLDRAKFNEKVEFRYVDMTQIPPDLRDFDFCWSICAFEHLGSIEKGIKFIENSLDVLRPGGFSVHTTEFNFMNDDETLDNWSTVLFQREHFEEMARRIEAKGCQVAPLNFDVGNKPLDKFIDVAPYAHDWRFDQAATWRDNANHIKLTADGIPVTCFGIIAYKP